MKLGVAFNIFSGAEFLKPALQNIRKHADVVVGLYTEKSMTEETAPPYLEGLLKQLKNEGLFDKVIKCPSVVCHEVSKMQAVQRSKYIIGQAYCEQAGCTHFQLRDCDEFYDNELFANMLDTVQATGVDLTVARIREYIGNPIHKAKGLSGLCVPVIHKIGLRYVHKAFPMLLDKSRTVNTEQFLFCKPAELVMHHFTGSRFDKVEMQRKFQGHPHFIRLGSNQTADYLKTMYEPDTTKWDKVNGDVFGIMNYWENEFSKII